MKITNKTASIIGTVVFMRSEETDCKCCDGKHIFSTGIKFDEIKPSKIFTGLKIENIQDFISEALQLLPNIEGKKVKLELTILKEQ